MFKQFINSFIDMNDVLEISRQKREIECINIIQCDALNNIDAFVNILVCRKEKLLVDLPLIDKIFVSHN